MFQLHGKPGAYVISTLIGLALSAATWRRAVPYWTAAADHARVTRSQKDSRLLHVADLVSGLLLAGAGYLGAGAALSGWVTPVAVFAAALFLFPWSSIPLFHRGMLLPSAMVALGAAVHMYTAARLPHPIMFLAAAWMLWLTAVSAWLHLIVLSHGKPKPSDPSSRNPAEHPDSVLHN